MATNLTVNQSISIKSIPGKVWTALTSKELNRKLLAVIFPMDFEKAEQGKILDIIPEKLLHTAYPWSRDGNHALPNHYHIIYKLEFEKNSTTVFITHENIETKKKATEIKEAWWKFLSEIKEVLEAEEKNENA